MKATEQPIDTATAARKCFLDMLGVFAEFETNLRRERQLEGIAKAKAAGVYNGRPASIDATKVRQMKAQGMGASEIAKALIGRASVYRALGERSVAEGGPGGPPGGGIWMAEPRAPERSCGFACAVKGSDAGGIICVSECRPLQVPTYPHRYAPILQGDRKNANIRFANQ